MATRRPPTRAQVRRERLEAAVTYPLDCLEERSRVLGMREGFSGYLLSFDQTAYWATVVGINLNGTAPFLGPFLSQFLRSGAEISGDTLTRFYSIHMLLVPGAIIGLIVLHLYLVI